MSVQLRNLSSQIQTVTVVLPSDSYTKTVFPGNFLLLSNADFGAINPPLLDGVWDIIVNPPPVPPPTPPVIPGAPNTDALPEGVTNLYFTNLRAQNAVTPLLASKVDAGLNAGTGASVFKQVAGTTMQFNSIKAGANISVGLVGSDITIASTATGSALTADLDLHGFGLVDSIVNHSISIKVNGTGSLWAESSTSPLQGNPRGQSAVDLQLYKTDAAHVASGKWSCLLSGYDNSATADYSAAVGGTLNRVIGLYSAALGGQSNFVSGLNSATLGGANVSVSGNQSVGLGAAHNVSNGWSLALGSGAATMADCDLVIGNNPATGIPSLNNNHFRVAGDSSDVHVGRASNQSVVAGASNMVWLHTVNPSNQSNAVTLSAPTTLTSTVNLILPSNAGSAGQVLSTDGTGNLSWVSGSGSVIVYAQSFNNTNGSLPSGVLMAGDLVRVVSGYIGTANPWTVSFKIGALVGQTFSNNIVDFASIEMDFLFDGVNLVAVSAPLPAPNVVGSTYALSGLAAMGFQTSSNVSVYTTVTVIRP